MEMPEDVVDDVQTISPIKGLVDQAFQISWLIPHDGGKKLHPVIFIVVQNWCVKLPIKYLRFNFFYEMKAITTMKEVHQFLHVSEWKI